MKIIQTALSLSAYFGIFNQKVVKLKDQGFFKIMTIWWENKDCSCLNFLQKLVEMLMAQFDCTDSGWVNYSCRLINILTWVVNPCCSAIFLPFLPRRCLAWGWPESLSYSSIVDEIIWRHVVLGAPLAPFFLLVFITSSHVSDCSFCFVPVFSGCVLLAKISLPCCLIKNSVRKCRYHAAIGRGLIRLGNVVEST